MSLEHIVIQSKSKQTLNCLLHASLGMAVVEKGIQAQQIESLLQGKDITKQCLIDDSLQVAVEFAILLVWTPPTAF